jgi:hypothetical protein
LSPISRMAYHTIFGKLISESNQYITIENVTYVT